jgi:hypothetical protein
VGDGRALRVRHSSSACSNWWPGALSVTGLRASTEGRSGTATSRAAVDRVSLAEGLLRAGDVSSSCASTPSASTGTATLAALSLAGSPLPITPAPNTPIEVPGVLRGVLNEQIPRDGGDLPHPVADRDGQQVGGVEPDGVGPGVRAVTFGFVHILLRPDSGYVASTSSRTTVIGLFIVFGVLSLGFWAYFRFRPARAPAPAA